jgi:ribosomal protein L11 methyltransferase
VVKSTPEEGQWMEVTITVHPVAHDALSAFLFDLGCSGISAEGADRKTLKAYLPRVPDPAPWQHRVETRLRRLGTIFPEAQSFQLDIHPLPEENWTLKWREHFRPQQITDHLVIYPAWELVPPGSDHVIRIDPGPAFGTGMHPTTQMCLEAMERFCRSLESRPWTMLDVGTGSGILAIYGALLGARRIVALDIDPEALRWAKENAELNGVAGDIAFTHTPLAEVRNTFTLITANLSIKEIAEMSPRLPSIMGVDSCLVVSGLLGHQIQVAAERLRTAPLDLADTLSRGEWRCLVLHKKG